MTQTLEQLKADQRALLLARIARRYLPNPGIDPPSEISADDAAVQERILEEIKTHLRIASEEDPEDQKALINYLSEGISRAVLENADLKAIEHRAEQRTAAQLVSRLQDEEISQAEASAYSVELIQRFEPLLRNVWHRYSGQGVPFEDFTQEVYLGVFRSLDALQDPRAFPGYIRTIAYRVAVNYLRKQRPTSLQENFESWDTKLEEGIREDALDLIQIHLEDLPPRERDVLKLYLQKWSTAAIAEKFNISMNAVRLAKSRSIRRLKKIFEDIGSA